MAGRKPEIEDQDILAVFIDSDDPVLSTAEVAGEFDYSTTGINKRLKKLRDNGLVDSKKVGQNIAWWITEQGIEFASNRK